MPAVARGLPHETRPRKPANAAPGTRARALASATLTHTRWRVHTGTVQPPKQCALSSRRRHWAHTTLRNMHSVPSPTVLEAAEIRADVEEAVSGANAGEFKQYVTDLWKEDHASLY